MQNLPDVSLLLYSPEREGHSPERKGCTIRATRDCLIEVGVLHSSLRLFGKCGLECTLLKMAIAQQCVIVGTCQ